MLRLDTMVGCALLVPVVFVLGCGSGKEGDTDEATAPVPRSDDDPLFDLAWDADGDDESASDDCDEEVGRAWYTDGDGDGAGGFAAAVDGCDQPAGAVATPGDCDDSSASIYPGAAEICDGLDNDCDGVVDDGMNSTWYTDADADGFGDAASPIAACAETATGLAPVAGDCDDGDAAISPGVDEACEDGLDNDCDGEDSTCAMNTEGVTYAACSAWAPYDTAGATWTWDEAWGYENYTWEVSNAGAGTYAGLDIWIVTSSGTEYWGEDTSDLIYTFSSELGVTCEEDGLHLVYETQRRALYGRAESETERTLQFSDRPLLLPLDLSKGDSWTVDKVDFGIDPTVGDTYDPATYTVFTVGGEDTLTLDGVDYTERKIDLTNAAGTSTRWWLVEGLGLVETKTSSGLRFQVTSLSGL